MKKNAFTLVELLGVISILGLIVLIALPTVEKNIKNSKQKLYEAQINNIESGLKNWATNNLFYLPSDEGEMITLTLFQLKQGGYVDKEALNPLTDELFPNDMLLTITKKVNSYEYSLLLDTGTPTKTAEVNPDAPLLLLNGGAVLYVEVHDSYFDPGVTALNSEGNLINPSNIVTTISGDGSYVDTDSLSRYIVKYVVTDPDNGYKTTVTRTVIVRDTTKPSLVVPDNITLNSTDVLTFNARTGAGASDNYDGDLTSQIEITGSLSILPGTYYLTYSVSDSSGNITTGKRSVIVNSAPLEYYIYNEGVNSNAWVTGSATSSPYVTVTRTKEAIDLLTTVSSSDDYTVGSAGWVTDNLIDLTNYSTLKIDSSVSGSCNYMQLRLSTTKTTAQPDEPEAIIQCNAYPSGSRNITSLDISSMNGSFYIKFILNVRGLENGTAKLYKVWLEP